MENSNDAKRAQVSSNNASNSSNKGKAPQRSLELVVKMKDKN